MQKLLSVIVAIEKGATRFYRLGLSLSLALLTLRMADGPGENIIIAMVTFLSRDVTLSQKAVVEERFYSRDQLFKRSLVSV